jgi:hypothetical protein
MIDFSTENSDIMLLAKRQNQFPDKIPRPI